MNSWQITLISVAASLLAFLFLIRFIATRKNQAGISTSVSSRSVQIGSLVTRSIFRKLRLRMRQLISRRSKRKELEQAYHIKTAEEAAKMMGNMKGVFMKLGQIASFAQDTLPPPAQAALRELQQDAPPMDFSLVRQMLESELLNNEHNNLEQLFIEIEEEPIAAASIGQVHRGKLRSGQEIVLKVQYPGVDKAIEADLKFSSGLAGIINAVHKNADAKAVIEELKTRLTEELDYNIELRNQQIFYELWKDHPFIHIPQVFPKYSSKRVLCQEYMRGLNFYDFLEIANDREKELAIYVLNDFVFDSMHKNLVFNGDPHPGNYIFREDGGIVFLDFGCIKRFQASFIDDLLAMNRDR